MKDNLKHSNIKERGRRNTSKSHVQIYLTNHTRSERIYLEILRLILKKLKNVSFLVIRMIMKTKFYLKRYVVK